MPSRTKTLILPFHPDINPGKLRQITKITKRCTFAVSLFLDEAKAKKLYDSKTLEQCRKSIETRTGLSSGFVQACRDKAKTVLKPYPDRFKQWESKLEKLEKEQLKLEARRIKYETKLAKARSTTTKTYLRNRQTLANTRLKDICSPRKLPPRCGPASPLRDRRSVAAVASSAATIDY